jgi:hypothetical protein
VRADNRLAHTHQASAWTFRTDALATDPCALEQQEQFVGEKFGLRQARVAA